MTQQKRTCVSAPGKVLISGGYLVLFNEFSGLVAATSSRFVSTVSTVDSEDEKQKKIVVRSPQFEGGKWVYRVGKDLKLENEGSDRNKYVEYAVALSLKLAKAANPSAFDANFPPKSNLDICIVGHNDFYSQRPQLESLNLPLTSSSLASLDPFCHTLTTIANVHKTGLGSSAAMITSLVAALLQHFDVIALPDPTPATKTTPPSKKRKRGRSKHASTKKPAETPSTTSTEEIDHTDALRIAHNTSQFIHCLAQGKIGSGFDVSSAVYGSHTYTRFTPSVLDALMSECEASTIYGVPGSRIFEVVQSDKWDSKVERVQLPPGVELMLADVDAGSSTPSLVKGILEWRTKNPEECKTLWKSLHTQNLLIAETLRTLHTTSHTSPKEYAKTLAQIKTTHAETWSTSTSAVTKHFAAVHAAFLNVRKHLQEMSRLAGVPVEPESQTRLLDEIAKEKGVVMCGVPGAGGFDAIFVLVVGKENRVGVEKVWAGWKESKVGPLLATADSGAGLRREIVEEVEGLARFF
ncbi:phosphomevalonate kinase [Rhizoclosmatium hyalinum]|nr:phosphomevalonate kinase [Rhizoclosmatium hyalinum]